MNLHFFRCLFPVPLGFLYIQLSGQDPPNVLWPSTHWNDVSSSYAGLFFRVVGGEAADFGQIQEANTTRLDEVRQCSDFEEYNVKIPADGSWSKKLYTSWLYKTGGDTTKCLQFRHSTSEIRPRNQAVKIWKRVAN